MIQGSMTLGQAGIVSVVSMAVVFVVLLVLYLAVLIFGKVASSRKPKAQPAAVTTAAPAAPAQDDRDLFCVLAAAVAAYEEGSGNPMVRNRGDLD